MNQQIPFRVALFLSQTPRWGILQGILDYVRAHGNWQLYSQSASPGEEQSLVDLRRWGCTGIVLVKSDDPAFCHVAAEANVPVVEIQPSFTRTSSGHFLRNQSYTWVENAEIAEMAADFFVGRHFQNFAFVGNVKRLAWSVERGRAFRTALRRRWLNCHIYKPPRSAADRRDWAKEEQHMRAWLAKLPKPCAIFAANDERGRQVLDACLAEGIDVPGAVAVLGVDNDPFVCETAIPPLSSIALDNNITEVFDHLARRMADPSTAPRRISINPARVVTRDSTGFVHHDKDAVIAKSLAYIARETAAGKILSVKDVVRHSKCSRRTLETHFRLGLKRSILDEIRRCQLDQVRELLTSTSLGVSEIAAKTGFLSVNRLEQRFAQVYGTTMRGYRRQKSFTSRKR